MAVPVVRTRRWSRVEYERLVDLGMFHPGEHLELLDGFLVVREPQGAWHATAVRAIQDTLARALGSGWDVRPQLPVALDEDSEPEPDVAVVRGSYADYRHAHPAHPVLVVEVADSTLVSDRRKAGLYARAGVPEYWIADLAGAALEVHRRPVPSPGSRFGWSYGDVRAVGPGDDVTPLAAPSARIPVSALLP